MGDHESQQAVLRQERLHRLRKNSIKSPEASWHDFSRAASRPQDFRNQPTRRSRAQIRLCRSNSWVPHPCTFFVHGWETTNINKPFCVRARLHRLRKNSIKSPEVSGHDFSRAASHPHDLRNQSTRRSRNRLHTCVRLSTSLRLSATIRTTQHSICLNRLPRRMNSCDGR